MHICQLIAELCRAGAGSIADRARSRNVVMTMLLRWELCVVMLSTYEGVAFQRSSRKTTTVPTALVGLLIVRVMLFATNTLSSESARESKKRRIPEGKKRDSYDDR